MQWDGCSVEGCWKYGGDGDGVGGGNVGGLEGVEGEGGLRGV